MSPKSAVPPVPPRQPAGDPPPAWPHEDNDAAWEGVLDCGAPGPARAEPALFYQAQRAPAPAGERRAQA